jgi:hypothetical protein
VRARNRAGHCKATALGAAVAVLTTALIIIGQASAGTTAAYYTASITSPSPAKIAAGATVPVTVKITNCDTTTCAGKASTTTLGSADVTFPTGFTLSGSPVVTSTGGNNWSASVSGNTVRLRTPESSSNYLTAGKSVTVTVNVKAPASVDPTKNPYTVTTQAKRDGDFDDLALARVGSDPQLTVYLPLDHFQVTAAATAIAGAPFDVTVAAKDAANTTITGYTGTVHFVSTDPLNVLPGDYAFTSTDGGTHTFTGGVTFKTAKPTPGQTLTVNDTVLTTKTGSANVVVVPGPLTLTFSAFTPSPGLAKLATPVSSDSSKPAAVTPVTVLAKDEWGNLALPGTEITVDLSPSGHAGTVTGTRTVGTDSAGVASFANLNVAPIGDGYAFIASANVSTAPTPAVSGLFNVSNDVAVCTIGSAACSNSAVIPNGQAASTSLTAGGSGSFNGEFLLTTFSTDPLAAPDGACDGLTTVGSGGEVSVTGGNPLASQPTFTITLTVPASVLNNPSKQAWQYDVCLGAKSFDPAPVAWKTKTLVNFFTRKDAVLGADNRYWGLVPRCIWVSGDPTEFFLNFLPIPATNPCIVSKTRPAGGDLTIVLRKPYPWDGRWGIDG